ncbi:MULTISPECIES: LysM peptidoglycan-binding domain-containing protein [Mumia]|uniref:LysM domain-containing protein n=1 Tax=Mumia xiangluensis TaxID=1678900 RepID=A0ABW1QPW3_9ACTN|nr:MULTISPECIES: LysM domain-containing protein [Mumia]
MLPTAIPAAVLVTLLPHVPGALTRIATLTSPYAPRLDSVIRDAALLGVVGATGWLTALSVLAWSYRAVRRPIPAVVLTLTPRVWRPVIAAAAGAAVLAASPAGAAPSASDTARTTGSEGSTTPTSVAAAPPASAVAGLALPDRPARDVSTRGRSVRAADDVTVSPGTRAPGTRAPGTRAPGPGAATERLPSPSRDPSTRRQRRSYEVRVGDTLWSIATDALRTAGVRPTTRRTNREWRRWYAVNRAAIGRDPDALPAGITLRPPAPRRTTASSTPTAPPTAAPPGAAPTTAAPATDPSSSTHPAPHAAGGDR